MTAAPSSSQPEAAALRQHTPTPWTIEFNEKSGRFTFLGERGDGNVRASDGYGTLFSLDASVRNDADVVRFPRIDPEMAANASLIFEAVNNYAALRSRVEELTDLARFLLDRLDEHDPGDDDAERDFHGHVAPAMARLASALSLEDRK